MFFTLVHYILIRIIYQFLIYIPTSFMFIVILDSERSEEKNNTQKPI